MFFEKIANNSNAASLAARLRRKCFGLFLTLLSKVERPLTILDIGGTVQFWEVMGFDDFADVEITVLNVGECSPSATRIKCVQGNALALNFPDQFFDIIFSNSVVEHVGNLDAQCQMAKEIRRVAKRYFVQTPNKNFFLEPHFHFPYSQFFPVRLRVWLLMRFDLGWYKKEPDETRARKEVEEVRLLTQKEFHALFPGSTLYKEKILGLKKSFVAYAGWE